jgi:predicted phage-related endonuclease
LSADGLCRESVLIESVGDWLERRRRHITASRLGALFDVHPFLSREQLAGELQGQSTKGDTAPMRRGRILEAAVIEALKEAHPDWTIERCRTYHWLPEHRIGATPDAFFAEGGVDDGLIECKTVHPRKWEEWHGAPPLQYTLQTLTGLMCTGRTRGLLACMILSPDYPVYEFEVPRHPAAEQRILDAVAHWWQAYDAGRIAAPQPVEELEALFDDGSHKDLSDREDIRQALADRREMKAEISRLNQRLGECEYLIKNTIGPASTAWLPGYSITFRRHHRREYTVPAAEVRTLKIKEISLE